MTKEEEDQKKQEQMDLEKEKRIRDFVVTTKYSDFYQQLIPNKHFKSIRADDSRIYGGRFTLKGNYYYCSSQDSVLLYDTRDPYNWTLKSRIPAQQISWTVTDMDVTPDEQFLIYSSIDPYVRLVDMETLRRKQEFLDLSGAGQRNGWHGGSGIMSLKFSGDGKEILGGTKAA